MCTISWLYEADQYHVFFNRDEQKTRASARPPESISENGVVALMPIDPVGGGSWISTNSAGCTLALLNFYQGLLPKGRLVSRGRIIRRLCTSKNGDEIEAELALLTLQKFAPFTLLLFESGGDKRVTTWRWTGRALELGYSESPLISSAKYYSEVQAARLERYQKLIASTKNNTAEDFRRLHRDHGDKPSAFSFCMHREDASTVSFSHIEVGHACTLFRYQTGAPCEQRASVESELRLAQ